MWLQAAQVILFGFALTTGAPSGATVQAVVDPLRLDVQTDDGQLQGIRLAGVASDGLCVTDLARARTADLVSALPLNVQLAAEPPQPDADGRLAAYVWLPDGANLAEVLIREGDV